MTAELEATLQTLCEDLAQAAASPQSVREILESMQRLVSTFRAARRVLGRLLWQSPAAVQRALYDPASAAATLRLLAALAVDSVANQRRIARHLSGVWLPQRDLERERRSPETQLFVLTLPSALRVQYQHWNRRRRELRGRRLPSGDAPRLDGVPAPCLCDDCLGADQLLATWLQHFRDLSKWSATSAASNNEPAAAEEDDATAAHHATRLSAHTFLAAVLRDSHELRRDVVQAPSHDAAIAGWSSVSATAASVVYYFVPKSQRAAEAPMDPLQHVCAIAMQRDECVATSQCSRRHQPSVAAAAAAAAVGESVDTSETVESLERVELWATEMDIEHCDATQEDAGAVDGGDGHPSPEAEDHAALSIIEHIRSFLEPTTVEPPTELWDVIVRRPTRGKAPIQLHTQRILSRCVVRFIVDVVQQRLQIESRVLESSGATAVFVASVARADLPLLSSADDNDDDALALLRLDGESLGQLALRLCDHQEGMQHHSHGSTLRVIVLRRQRETEIHSTEPTEDAAAVLKAMTTATTTNRQRVADAPMPGLEDVSTHLLQTLERDLTLDSALTSSQVITAFVRVIRQCDARMTALATATLLSEATRSAARERCRGCRDLLVRASKRIRLCAGASTQSAALSIDARAIARKTIARVLRDSAATESWERCDERVERLHLSRHAWSSGVPDAEFFVDSAARARERKRIQQRLNRQLQQQQRHGGDHHATSRRAPL